MEQAGGLEELRAVLMAYKLVKDASWPDLHPTMARQSAQAQFCWGYEAKSRSTACLQVQGTPLGDRP